MKTNERAKSKTDSERREHDSPMRKDKPDQRQAEQRPPEPHQPLPRQPDQRDPLPRQPGPMERRPGSPRERSDEDTIGRPVQLDEEHMDDLDEPDGPTKGEPQRERHGVR